MTKLIRIVMYCILLLTLAGVTASAQADRQANTLLFGVGGGGLVGVTYDRELWHGGRVAVNANAGAGYLIFGVGFPHGVSVTVGGSHRLELGITGSYYIVKPLSLGILGPADDSLETRYRVTPVVGYRRQPEDGGMAIRAWFSPFIHNDENLLANDNASGFSFVPWGGLAFGFSF